jgi:hypothetical protein
LASKLNTLLKTECYYKLEGIRLQELELLPMETLSVLNVGASL